MSLVLTFDDGPSNNFRGLLNFLIKNKLKAIFFCTGQNLQKKEFRKDLIKAIKLGFILGNHSFSHPNFNQISFSKGKEEILKTDKIIGEIYSQAKVSRKVKFFRFPSFREGGVNFFKYQDLLRKEGYSHSLYVKGRARCQKKYFFYHFIQGLYRGKFDVYCTLDPADWNTENNFQKIKPLLKNIRKDEIINLHDKKESFELDKMIINALNC